MPDAVRQEAGPRERLHTLFGLIAAGWRGAPMAVTALYSGAAVRGLASAAEVWALGGLVQALTASVAAGGLAPGAALWLGLMVGLRFFGIALGAVLGWVEVNARTAQERVVASALIQKGSRIPLILFETPGFFNRLNRAQGAQTWVFDTVHRFVRVAENLFTLIGLTWVAGRVEWAAPALILAGGVAAMPYRFRFGINHYALQRGATPDVRWVQHLASLLTRRDTAKEVRLFDLGGYFVGRWRDEYERVRQRLFRFNTRQRQGQAAVGLIPIAAFGAALYVLLRRLGAGGVDAGTAVGALYALLRLQDAWEGASGTMLNLWGFYMRVMGDLVDFLALTEPKVDGRALNAGAHQIDVDAVHFTYPGNADAALRGVTLSLAPGEKVALVGENGSGKTTLVHLLLGLLPPGAGRIAFDGDDVASLDERSLWRQSTSVFQDFMRYRLTLRENIGLGLTERLGDASAIRHAAAKGGADAVAADLSDGYEAMLGPEFGGRDLSVGQWQKVATARAFMRDDDARLLVLDEPTAALDPKAEVEIYKRFLEMAGERTAILISHRLGFARLADRIIVLRDGRIAESGTHAELLRQGGEYAALYETQAQWYR